MSDPLESLVVDNEEVARTELAEGLSPYLRLTRGGELMFEPSFDALKALQKVCVSLLGVRVAEMIGLRAQPGATPAQLVQLTGLPPGTVRPKLSELVRLRLAAKHGDSYEIPTHAISRALKAVPTSEER